MTPYLKAVFFLLLFHFSIFSQDIDSTTDSDTLNVTANETFHNSSVTTDTSLIINDSNLIDENDSSSVTTNDIDTSTSDSIYSIADTTIIHEEVKEIIPDCVPKCRKGYICVNGECLPIVKNPQKSHVSIGKEIRYKEQKELGDLDRLFISTNIIYSIGSWYSAITPMIYSQKSWHRYSYYDEGHYDKFEVIIYAPGSSVYITFGSMNLTQIGKSASLLKRLGGTPASELQKTGIILSSAAFATTALNITSIFLDNKTYTASTSLVNAAVIISAYAVNTATYAVNRKRIKKTKAFRTENINNDNSIDISPYVYTDGKQSGAGLALKF